MELSEVGKEKELKVTIYGRPITVKVIMAIKAPGGDICQIYDAGNTTTKQVNALKAFMEFHKDE